MTYLQSFKPQTPPWISKSINIHNPTKSQNLTREKKKELIAYEFNGIEFEDLDTNDKKRFNLKSGIKIKQVTNEDYAEYADDLKGSIVTQVDNMRVTDMESVSAYLAKKEATEKTRYQIIAKNGQMYRIFL